MTMNSTAVHKVEDSRSRATIGAALARSALGASLLCAGAALLAGPAYRMGWLALGAVFDALRWATFGAIAAGILALLAGGGLALLGAKRGRVAAALALVVAGLVAGPLLYTYRQAQSLPKIHDISTDTAEPPAFIAVLPLRKNARNPVDYKAETAAQQRQGYPDIASLKLDLPPAQAFERAERAARAMGWQIVAAAPDALRIEATDTTLFFGFKDDVVIRIRAQGPGSLVDVRSLSRIGGSDIGANAKRVRAFLAKLATA
jgi:uncharacterized protein (DUF1499 family)